MQETSVTLEFPTEDLVDASLSAQARGLVGSEILKIAAEVRKLIADGRPLCNLTVGDFNSKYFPIPKQLSEGLQLAIRNGETNYPPSDGMPVLRQAVTEFVAREWSVKYPIESVLIASGARPVLYAAFRCVVDPGDTVIYPVPSWNNNHYSFLTGAKEVAVPTRAEDGFMPTLAQLAPHLAHARLLCLNSPLNPTGTVIAEQSLREIVEAVVEENHQRARQGQKHLFLLHDQVYASLIFGSAKHCMPTTLVPESAPWVISLDGISKSLAATGLRVGWVLAAPALVRRMASLIGHVGAWAPRAEQVAVAAFLRDEVALATHRRTMDAQVRARLDALYQGFEQMRSEGYPVECVSPQGAIYLSLRLNMIGRRLDGHEITSNGAIRKLLLDRSGVAVVPFQAFGLEGETGWFRLSVGAVSPEQIADCFPRIRELLDRLE